MSNLFASLKTAASSMKAYEEALGVVQNNVTNANTPGYVSQQADLIALSFQPERDLPGGVRAGELISSRDAFSERAVWRQAQQYGRVAQTAAGLSRIEPVFDVAEGSGLAAAIDDFYASFSQLSVAPNDIPARQEVISAAERVARGFNYAATSLARAADEGRRASTNLADEINRIAGDIRDLNIEFRKDYRNKKDAGLDARLHASLEELAELADFTALPQEDGSVTILLGGQTPLVIGDKLFAIQADTSGSQIEIRDWEGNAITSQLQQGRLKGVLEFANQLLPSYGADLDRLAASLADRVNALLAGGVDINGQPPVVDLFAYDAGNGAARTLSVTAITPEEIAAADPAAPGGNGNALKLAALATSAEIDGFTFTEYYGQLAARVGREIASAKEDERSQSLLLAQARKLRDQVSAVNLDEEAAALVQYQRSYEASARLISVLNELTEVLLRALG